MLQFRAAHACHARNHPDSLKVQDVGNGIIGNLLIGTHRASPSIPPPHCTSSQVLAAVTDYWKPMSAGRDARVLGGLSNRHSHCFQPIIRDLVVRQAGIEAIESMPVFGGRSNVARVLYT